MHRLDLTDGRAVAVRRYVWPGFLDDEPDAPQREVDALRFAASHGLPVPTVLAGDVDGSIVGDGVPAIVMDLLPGRPRSRPNVQGLAEAAATIHAVDATELGHEYFPWDEEEMTRPPPLTTKPAMWERAMTIWRTETPTYQPVLIHRDFHPGNVLWWRARLTGVVDWANACRGPAGCDLATCWSNLAAWADRRTADAFVEAYRATTGVELHPYWQLANLLEAGASHWTLDNLAQWEPELARLLSVLSPR